MLITWQSDDITISPPFLCLCQSSRSVAEHNVRLNGRRLTEIFEAYRADTVQDIDRANSRLKLSFEVLRDCDFAPTTNGTAFTTADAAFYVAAKHLGDSNLSGSRMIRGTGTLTVALSGQPNLVFNNASLESADMSEWNGVAIKIQYVFNAASVT